MRKPIIDMTPHPEREPLFKQWQPTVLCIADMAADNPADSPPSRDNLSGFSVMAGLIDMNRPFPEYRRDGPRRIKRYRYQLTGIFPN